MMEFWKKACQAGKKRQIEGEEQPQRYDVRLLPYTLRKDTETRPVLRKKVQKRVRSSHKERRSRIGRISTRNHSCSN